MPDRRSMIVLAGLIAAMTLLSALLLVLEPGPIAPPLRAVNLRAASGPGGFERRLFDTTPPPTPQRWSAIVIYENGAVSGSARTIAARHHAMGLRGLGHHFVIENRTLDGRTIRSGVRWRRQMPGAHATGTYRHWYNQNAIGICLVANSDQQRPSRAQMRDLIDLVQRLQARFQISSSQVRLHADIDRSVRTGRHFPLAELQEGLLAPPG